jgi:hypothetical protein
MPRGITLFLGGKRYRNRTLQVGGVSKIEAIKYTHELSKN